MFIIFCFNERFTMGEKEMRNCKELKHEKNGNVTEKIGKNKGKSKKCLKMKVY